MPKIVISTDKCVICGKSQPMNMMRSCNRCKKNPVCQSCIKETMTYGKFCPECFKILPENEKTIVLQEHGLIRNTEKKGRLLLWIGIIGFIPLGIIVQIIFDKVLFGDAIANFITILFIGGFLGGGLFLLYQVHPNKRRYTPLPSDKTPITSFL